MLFAAKLPQMGPQINGPDVIRFAQAAEKMGFDIVSAGDHIVFPQTIESSYPYGDGSRNSSESAGNYIEPLTLLTWVGAATQKIQLFTGAIIAPYRHPVLSAKMISCLDFLTGGRVIVGIGVGWLKEEFDVLGASFEERGSVTDEIIEIYTKLWTEELPQHTGKYYQFLPVRFTPKPIQKPHPPIFIAGNSIPAMRRAARSGHGWFPIHFSSSELRLKLEQLQQMANSYGRNPSKLKVCLGSSLEFVDSSVKPDLQRRILGGGDPTTMIDELNQFSSMGVEIIQFDFRTRDVDTRLQLMERFMRDIRPHLKKK